MNHQPSDFISDSPHRRSIGCNRCYLALCCPLGHHGTICTVPSSRLAYLRPSESDVYGEHSCRSKPWQSQRQGKKHWNSQQRGRGRPSPSTGVRRLKECWRFNKKSRCKKGAMISDVRNGDSGTDDGFLASLAGLSVVFRAPWKHDGRFAPHPLRPDRFASFLCSLKKLKSKV